MTKVRSDTTEAVLPNQPSQSNNGVNSSGDIWEARLNGLAWTHACVVGVKAMDDQHGILVDTLNELCQQLARGGARNQLNGQMQRLVEFTRLHFGCEESLLERYGFPGLHEHRAAHLRLLSEIDRAAEHGENGQTNSFQKQLGSLSAAYLEHIEGLDRQYGAWLNDRGIY